MSEQQSCGQQDGLSSKGVARKIAETEPPSTSLRSATSPVRTREDHLELPPVLRGLVLLSPRAAGSRVAFAPCCGVSCCFRPVLRNGAQLLPVVARVSGLGSRRAIPDIGHQASDVRSLKSEVAERSEARTGSFCFRLLRLACFGCCRGSLRRLLRPTGGQGDSSGRLRLRVPGW